MSTPAYKKRARQEMHRKQKQKREYEALFAGISKRKNEPKTVVTLPWHCSGVVRRDTQHVPSLKSDRFEPCTKKTPMQYTGERKLVGIATMHKSNLVPVFADEDDKTGQKQATELAQMRRN